MTRHEFDKQNFTAGDIVEISFIDGISRQVSLQEGKAQITEGKELYTAQIVILGKNKKVEKINLYDVANVDLIKKVEIR